MTAIGQSLCLEAHARSSQAATAADAKTLTDQIRAFMAARRFDAAEALWAAAAAAFGNDREFAIVGAFCAQERGDLATALSRWQHVRAHFADHPYAHAAVASLLLARFDLAAAEAAIAPALILFPRDADVLANAIQVAITRADWEVAWRRLSDLQATLPDHPFTLAFAAGMGETITRGRQDAGSLPGAAVPDATSNEESRRLKQLMLQFETIGDNCELGLVQRHFGVEPLGLFRFAAVWPSILVDLLADRFSRLGDVAHTVLDDTGDDYVIKDDRDLYWMHSFVRIGEGDPTALLRQQIKRINYLKRELIDDLEAAEKTFVYKDSQQFVGDDVLRLLADGLASYGRNFLLAVRLADDDNPSGSTRLLNGQIMIGYIRKMFPQHGPDLDTVSWRQLLETAHRYKTTGRR